MEIKKWFCYGTLRLLDNFKFKFKNFKLKYGLRQVTETHRKKKKRTFPLSLSLIEHWLYPLRTLAFNAIKIELLSQYVLFFFSICTNTYYMHIIKSLVNPRFYSMLKKIWSYQCSFLAALSSGENIFFKQMNN